MNKPDWKDAPEWAQYLAMDSNGAWYWFECKPEWDGGDIWVNPSMKRYKQARLNRAEWASKSLEKRP